MKTKGQRLYEYEHPKYITVFEKSDVFRQCPFDVPNPREPAGWKFLTKECQERYERRVIGHHIFSGEQ